MYKFFPNGWETERSCPARKLIRIMRLTYILLLAFILSANAKGLAQNINLKAEQITLKKALNELHKITRYDLIYNSETVGNAKVSINLQNSSLDNALTTLLSPQGLSFKINEDDKTVVIFNAPKNAVAPPVQVTGLVTDEKGQPLPGVSIRIKGQAVSAVTVANGTFKMTVPDNNTVLVFSMIGFDSQEATVSSSPLKVTLKQANTNLSDIVVIGYGTQRKSDLTGSVAGIRSTEIEKTKSVSFMETMQGRIAGVQVTSNSGEPGAAVNVIIRGTNSFNSGTQPLYVIDGVQIDINNAEAASSGVGNTSQINPLAGINPSDIASIEVLKDASATAIFGSRGANGVILITTKSGKNNTPTIEVNTYAGLAWNPKHISMLGPQDYASYRLANGLADDAYAIDLNNDKVFDVVKDLSGVRNRDWQKEALRTALTQNYSLSFSGGGPKTNFLVSSSYLNQQGLIVNNKFERYTVLMKINHNATDRLRFGATANLSQSIGRGVASNGGNDIRGYNGLIQMLLLTRPVNAPDPTLLASDPDQATYSSPVDFANLSYKDSPLSRILTDINANYKIVNGLNFDAHAGAIFTMSKNREFYPSTVSWGIGTNGLGLLNNSNSINWYTSNTLTYNKKIANGHNINALLGFEINSYQFDSFRWQGQGFDNQNINPLDNIATANLLPVPPSTYKEKYVRISEFARLNYSFRDKYLLTATLRNDASSKLAENNKSAFFPSVGLAWRVTQEGFMKKQQFISDLKIRGSFGLTGNERIPPYQSLATLGSTYYSTASNTSSLAFAPNTVANPDLTWETTHTYDAGIDLSVLKGRLSLTADVYLKKTKDLLLQADIPSQSGFMKQYQNLGEIENRGVELALNGNIINKGSFTWNSNINISLNRNKVASLGSVSYLPVTVYGGPISTIGRVITGQPIGTAYGYIANGIYQLSDFGTIKNAAGATIDPSTVTSANYASYTYTLKPGVTSVSSRTAKPGDMKFKDLNNDGTVNSADATILSNSNPKHYGGFTNNFTYKNFDLSILFNWSYGNQILNLGQYRLQQGQSGYANVTQEYWDNRWTPERPSNKYPALNSQGKLDVSSYYVEDGSFLRLNNVTFGYTLNKSATLKRIGISSLRLYLTGTNLHVWTNYSGFDPEINSYSQLLPGVDNISYPRPRSIIFGANIKF
jgi:TonB-linked SusC/RagA family outer membrane protein